MNTIRENSRLKYLIWIDDYGDTTVVPEGVSIDMTIKENDAQAHDCIKAARMETAVKVNKINISESTYTSVSENSEFEFEYRGAQKAMDKGNMDMSSTSVLKPY